MEQKVKSLKVILVPLNMLNENTVGMMRQIFNNHFTKLLLGSFVAFQNVGSKISSVHVSSIYAGFCCYFLKSK